VANVLWAFARLGAAPSREALAALQGRAAAAARELGEQEVANVLWSAPPLGAIPFLGD